LRAEKPGIIYAATRRGAEEIAAELSDRDVRAIPYHAGLKGDDRSKAQTAFMSDEVEVIVATTAFGMGIDKPNVRFVFHADISDSVDSYYQEIGRAGRDGESARAILFYNPDDLNLRRFFAGGGQVNVDQVAQVAVTVQQAEEPLTLKALQQETALSQSKVTKALSRLEEVGVVELLPTGEVVAAEEAEDLGEALEEAAQAQEQYKQMGRSRLEMIRGYAEVRGCRREFLLNYFGETIEKPCGACDNCKAGVTVKQQDGVERQDGLQPFAIDSRVAHKSWGEGTVMRYEGDKVVVLFDKAGYKTLGIAMTLLYRHLQRL
jgi:ATP-dependent DNA helicase RecQ